jgi:hypothetical protein
MSVAPLAALVSCSLCAALKEMARPSSVRAKILMAKRMSIMAGIASENDCRKPRKPLNKALCVEQELQDNAQAQPPVR